MDYFVLIFTLVVLVYIWQKTDAFPEYFALFRLKFTKYLDFFEQKKNFNIYYSEFLILKSENFCTKLLNCSICLLTFLNILSFIIFKLNFKYLGFTIFFSWILYFFLLSVIKKTDE